MPDSTAEVSEPLSGSESLILKAGELKSSRWTSTFLKELGIVLLFVLVALVLYWKVLVSGQYSYLTTHEAANQGYSWYNFSIAAIKRLEWPLWDPYSFCGRSFPGEMQTGAFYPVNLVLAMVPFNRHGVFSPQLYHVLYACTHVLAAYFFYRLLRFLSLDRSAASVGGVCFSFGGILGGLEEWPHLLQTGIWTPVVVLLGLKANRSSTKLAVLAWGSLAGLCFGVSILAGGLHFAMMEGLILVSILLFDTFFRARDASMHRRQVLAATGLSAIALVLMFALASSAIQLLPSMEYSQLAYRFGEGGALPATEKIPYPLLTKGLQPNALVGLLFYAPAASIAVGEALKPYIGVLGLALAVVGLVVRHRDPFVRYSAGLTGASFLYSLGGYSLLHGVAYSSIPFLWLAREPARFMYVADFGLAILVGFGVDALRKDRSIGQSASFARILRWVSMAAGIALLVPAITSRIELSPWVSMSLLMILLSCLVLWITARRTRQPAWEGLLIGLILLDLYAFSWNARDKAQELANKSNSLEKLLDARGAVDFLRRQPGLFRVSVANDATPGIGQLFQIYTTMGSGATLNMDYDRIRGNDNILNVRYVMRPSDYIDPDPVYQDSAWKIYKRAEQTAPAWAVTRFVRYDSEQELKTILSSGEFDHLNAAAVPMHGYPALDSIRESDAPGVVRVTRYESRFIEVTAEMQHPALLVLSENDYPGWRADVNGVPVEIIKVNGGLRGVVIGPGHSTVRMQYSPASFRNGLWLSGTAILLCVTFWVLAVRRNGGLSRA